MTRNNALNCDVVGRELTVPTGQFDQAELADHLDRCDSCAEAAEQARRFDALWDATRPTPSLGTFTSVWSAVSAQAQAAPRRVGETVPRSRSAARPRWMRPRFVMLALAQAAAILVTALVLHHERASARTLANLNETAPE